MIVVVASGKGGTGKTTVTVNMARALGTTVQVLDCDVEEPHAHLFLNGRQVGSEEVAVPVPLVDESACDACGPVAMLSQRNRVVAAT